MKDQVMNYRIPVYVYDSEIINRRYSELSAAFKYQPTEIHYACKANDNLRILRLLRKLGAHAETVSAGEISKGLAAGFRPDRISYTSTSVSDEELKFVVRKKIFITIDSLSQLERYGRMNPGAKIALRLNQGIGAGHHSHVITGGPDSKFGIELRDLSRAAASAKRFRLQIVGLHQHIGSNILDDKILLSAAKILIKTAGKFKNLEFLNFGGGFGVPYRGERSLDIKRLGNALSAEFSKFCRTYGRQLKLVIEPGRYLVADSGRLLVQVAEIKRNSRHNFVGVNSGFNHLLRPAMYGAYHEIVNLSNPSGRREKVWIVGNLCESGDVFAKDRKIAKCRMGDILAIFHAGAYGYVMSSEYNSRPKPKEILI